MVRRDMESLFKRFWKCENTTINLEPLDPENPREGGRVVAKVIGLDVRTFTPYTKTYNGVYGEDFVTFGEVAAQGEGADADDALLKLMDNDAQDCIDKHTFKFANNQVTYSRMVNGEHVDVDVEHAIEESTLDPHMEQTWSEAMFYGIGNKNV